MGEVAAMIVIIIGFLFVVVMFYVNLRLTKIQETRIKTIKTHLNAEYKIAMAKHEINKLHHLSNYLYEELLAHHKSHEVLNNKIQVKMDNLYRDFNINGYFK